MFLEFLPFLGQSAWLIVAETFDPFYIASNVRSTVADDIRDNQQSLLVH